MRVGDSIFVNIALLNLSMDMDTVILAQVGAESIVGALFRCRCEVHTVLTGPGSRMADSCSSVVLNRQTRDLWEKIKK